MYSEEENMSSTRLTHSQTNILSRTCVSNCRIRYVSLIDFRKLTAIVSSSF